MKNLYIFCLIIIAIGILPTPARADNIMSKEKTEKATFAGGCFWCMEKPFEKLDGVIEVTSGYTGGVNSKSNLH